MSARRRTTYKGHGPTPCKHAISYWCPTCDREAPLVAVPHRRKPPTASDRPPVGAGSAEEPGSLFDARGRE